MHMGRLARTFLFSSTALLLSSCCMFKPRCETPCSTGCVMHIVLVDVADDSDIAAMRADSDRLIPTIKGVCGYQCGTPLDIGRAVVTSDYDLGILVQCASVEDYKAYLEAPAHKELVAKWRSKWKSSRIFDFTTTETLTP